MAVAAEVPYLGTFITLEGGEGAGKSSLLNHLTTFLTERGYPVVVTREPGGTSLGEAIRDLVLRHDPLMSIGTEAELLLFLAARAQHIKEKILPALEKGKIVLCDRFNDSTIAYQGGARGLGIDYVQRLCLLVCGAVVPRLTLFLDVSPEIGLTRSRGVDKEQSATGEFDRIESEALIFHQKIQQAFEKLAALEPLRIHTLNADQPQENVKREAVDAVMEILK